MAWERAGERAERERESFPLSYPQKALKDSWTKDSRAPGARPSSATHS